VFELRSPTSNLTKYCLTYHRCPLSPLLCRNWQQKLSSNIKYKQFPLYKHRLTLNHLNIWWQKAPANKHLGCLQVWRGREMRVLRKKERKKQVEEIEDIGMREIWGINFFSWYRILLIWETQKLYWRRDLDGLYEFFEFNLYCYNILKIKNILIININLSFSKKLRF